MFSFTWPRRPPCVPLPLAPHIPHPYPHLSSINLHDWCNDLCRFSSHTSIFYRFAFAFLRGFSVLYDRYLASTPTMRPTASSPSASPCSLERSIRAGPERTEGDSPAFAHAYRRTERGGEERGGEEERRGGKGRMSIDPRRGVGRKRVRVIGLIVWMQKIDCVGDKLNGGCGSYLVVHVLGAGCQQKKETHTKDTKGQTSFHSHTYTRLYLIYHKSISLSLWPYP